MDHEIPSRTRRGVDEIVATVVKQTLEDTGSAKQWRCQREGMKGMKFNPLSDPGGPFLIQTIKYCNISLSKFNENKQFRSTEGPMSVLKGPQGAHPRLKRAQSGLERGPSKLKRAKNIWFSFLGGGPLDQGTLPWLISPPSPELWLHCWEQTEENRVMIMPSWHKDNEQIISYLIVPGLQLRREE